MSDKRENEDIPKDNENMGEEFDVLNLPPRKDIHTNSKKTNVKWSEPLIRLLLVTVIMLAIIAAYVYYTVQ